MDVFVIGLLIGVAVSVGIWATNPRAPDKPAVRDKPATGDQAKARDVTRMKMPDHLKQSAAWRRYLRSHDLEKKRESGKRRRYSRWW